jgi:hypothetical protein
MKLALAALGGLVVGSLVGGIGTAYFYSDTMSQIMLGMWRDDATHTLADTTFYLRLLEDGKTDSVRRILSDRMNAATITLAAGTPDSSRNLLRKQVELANQIKSVQDDQSDIGKMAADARKRIMSDRMPAPGKEQD